jgi:uncharacterized protein YjbJ (UPF0337 family)
MNRDQVEGRLQSIKGRAKQAAAHVTDDPTLHDEGKADELTGKAQEGIGRAREKVGKAIEQVGRKLKR